MQYGSEPWEWRSRFAGASPMCLLSVQGCRRPPFGSEPWRWRSRSFMGADATDKAEGVTVRLSTLFTGKRYQLRKGPLVYASA